MSSDNTPSLVINGDDLGMSPEVNEAIVRAFEGRLISSASLMANMPGFDEACAAIHENKLNGKIGVHINLVEGRPLTPGISHCARFCGSDGNFSGHGLSRALRVTQKEKNALLEEMRAQVQRCLDKDVLPTHIDSHHHFHTSWPIGSIVNSVAKEKNIVAVRRSGIFTRNKKAIKRLHRAAFNMRLSLHGLAKTDYSCSLLLAPEVLQWAQGVVEIVMHPRLDASGNLTDLAIPEDLSSVVEKFRGYSQIPYPQ